MTGLVAAASFVACDKEPVGAHVDPQLTIAAECVAVNLFTSASVFAAVLNTGSPTQP
jgi:hypothetical protein